MTDSTGPANSFDPYANELYSGYIKAEVAEIKP